MLRDAAVVADYRIDNIILGAMEHPTLAAAALNMGSTTSNVYSHNVYCIDPLVDRLMLHDPVWIPLCGA